MRWKGRPITKEVEVKGEERMGLKAMTLGTKTKVEGVSGPRGEKGEWE